MNKIKVINEPSELVPMLRAVDTPIKREVLKEVTVEWRTAKEIEDRYGNVPPSVANLIEIALIRSMATLICIDEVMQKENGVIFSFSNERPLDFATISKLIEEFKGKVLFSPSTKSYITLRQKGGGLLNNIKSLLQGYKRLKDEEE